MKVVDCSIYFVKELDKAMAALKTAVDEGGIKFSYCKGRLSGYINATELFIFSLSTRQRLTSTLPFKIKEAKYCIVQCSKSREEKLQ